MHKLHDRIKETSLTPGDGDMLLRGAVAGFSAFSDFYADGDTFFYCVTDDTSYEVGYGSYNQGANTITRIEVFKSSSTDQLVSWPNGVKEVYVTYPTDKSVYQPFDSNGVSGELSYWEDANTLGSTSGVTWDAVRGNLTVPNDLIALNAISGLDYFVENSIHFDGYSTPQTKPFLPNTLLNGTRIDEVVFVSGEVNHQLGLNKQNPRHVLAGPINSCGGIEKVADYPAFRPLEAADLPSISASSVLYTPVDSNDWPVDPINAQEGFDYLANSVANITDLFPGTLPASGGNADTLDYLDSTDFALADHDHENLIFARIVESDQEFNLATEIAESQAEIFNNWYRFSHNTTLNQPANTSELNDWNYDEISEVISCTINSTSYIGFVSTREYSDYTVEAVLESGDTTINDNDMIGVVIAFHVDGEGREHTLSLVVLRSAESHVIIEDEFFARFAIVYNYAQSDETLIGDFQTLPTGPWNSSGGIKVKVERDGDTIKAFRSDFNSRTLREAEGEFLQIDLNNYPELFKFKGRQKYGLSCLSQNNSTFTEFNFINNDDIIYNLVDGKVYVFDTDTTAWIESLDLDFSNIGEEIFVFNEDTDKLYYVKNQNSIENVSNKIDQIRVNNNIEIGNYGYLEETVMSEPYFFEVRQGAVRMNRDGMVGISLEDRATAYADPGKIGLSSDELETNGLEAEGFLPRTMYALRRDGDDIYMDVNASGEVKSLLLGTVT